MYTCMVMQELQFSLGLQIGPVWKRSIHRPRLRRFGLLLIPCEPVLGELPLRE